MKKKDIIFFCFLFIFYASNISAVEVTIGSGTSTDYNPFYHGYTYVYEVNLYTAAEIGSAMNITRLDWYNNGGATTCYARKIYLKEISNTTLPSQNWSTMTTGATLVYNGDISFSATTWGGINLSTTFDYSGSNSLLVMTERSGGSGGSGSFYYTSTASTHGRLYSDASAPTSNFSAYSDRCNLKITGTVITAPSAPTSNAAASVGRSAFSASWSASAGATKYYLDVSTVSNFASFVTGYNNLDVGNVTTYVVTGLTPNTTYYYRVRAYNTAGSSASSSSQSLTTTSYPSDQNLLTNPGAELGNMTGWTVSENGGNGWYVGSGGIGGNYYYATSYAWDKKYQTIDLLAKGYNASELDAAPKVYVECWTGQRVSQDIFYFYAGLKNASSTVITNYNTGQISTPAGWTKYSYIFTGYGSGLRYITFENWGEDGTLGWAGHYGTHFDNEIVMVDRAGNDTPYLLLEGSVSYTEQSGTSALSPNASAVVRDIDSLNFAGGGLIVDIISNASALDSFSIRHQGTGAGQIGISGSNISYSGVNFATFTGGTSGSDSLIISFNSYSGGDTVSALINNIVYENRSDSPESTKTIRLRLCDGDGDTATLTQTRNLTNVNDSPVLTLPADSLTLIIGSSL